VRPLRQLIGCYKNTGFLIPRQLDHVDGQRDAMGQERQAAVVIRLGHEGPQAVTSRGINWHGDPPCLPGWRILDAHNMGRQVGLDRLNANHMHVRPDVEDLHCECDDGDVGLFRQTEPEPEGAVSRQVADKDVGERAVFFLFGASVTVALPVLHSGVTTRLTVVHGRCIGSTSRIRAGFRPWGG